MNAVTQTAAAEPVSGVEIFVPLAKLKKSPRNARKVPHGEAAIEALAASSRRVVGWAVSDRMKKNLAIRALDMAVRLRQPPEGCLFHSDRGSQYCSYDYQKKLQAYDLRPSMSGKDNCYDNASVETFFKSLKAELIWRQSWPTRRQAEAAIFQYINGFYNTRRRHSYPGGISPLAFEPRSLNEIGDRHKTVTSPGSATDDNRPEFQKMIAWVESDEHPVDIILVHSLSRLFRNALDFMHYRERLRCKKIRIISVTQNFGDDPASDMAVAMLAIFDEYHSAENAKHVRRAMIANAVNGFWNGQTPPLGFRTYAVPQPRGKDRKKLEHDPDTVDLVRYMFNTYLEGTADGPVGVTTLADHLNQRGERIQGKEFSHSRIHDILTNTAYIGYVIYNRRCSHR